MIGHLRGRLVTRQPPQIIVDVHGVGYELEVPLSTLAELPRAGEELSLLTHLVVRDDAHVLYGFATEDERRLFRSLIKVSGVGARLALAILSGISVPGFVSCVEQEDVASLMRLPGIGKKTAQRLIVEMRDRLPEIGFSVGGAPQESGPGATPAQREAYDALLALGYKAAEASRMLRNLDVAGLDTAEIVRLALRGPGDAAKGAG